MAERATARAAPARAAPLAKSPARDAATTARRGGSGAPSGPPVLRLVTRPQTDAKRAREEALDALVASPGAGDPIIEPVRRQVESSLRVDLSTVRVHTDSRTRAVVDGMGARAFAWGRRIFLGSGQSPADISLIAHEAAHVVQQQGAPRVQMADGAQHADALEHEARSVSAAVASGERATVVGRTTPRPQFAFEWVKKGVSAVGSAVSGAVSAVAETVGDIAGAALSFIKDKANNIPGYAMLGFILGRDPITQQPVQRNAVNLIRAVMGLWPGGNLIFEALQNHGIIDKVGAWLETQLDTLKSVVGGIRKALDDFIKTLGIKDLADLGGAWDRAKRIFTEPIDKATSFVKGLAADVLRFIRDAILLPIAKLAEGTRGYDLLKAVLGKDPITGEAVPQDAMTLIGGFLKLIGEEEMFENMKKANALPRAWAWFQKALAELKLFVAQIPPTFISALKALDITDMILIPKAYIKLGKVFGGFLLKFISWAGGTIWNLLEIIFDVVSPGALEYIKKTGDALKSILKNPLPFVGNLVKAAKLGFEHFADNFWGHLKAALLDWLLGALPGVYIPKALELMEIVKFVFSVLGLSWANIRAKLVKVVGETVVTAMETGFKIVVTLVKEGPAAAWEQIKGELANLKDQVISAIIGFVVDTIVKKAVPKLIAMFIPGAGFISAILSIYDTVMVFVEKIATIIQVVKGFIDSIVNIANGVIDAAANKVETTLAKLMSLAISFLAGFLGLGKIADKIMGAIGKVRAMVDKAIDSLIAWIVKMAKTLFGKAKAAVGRLAEWWKHKKQIDADGQKITLATEGNEQQTRVTVAQSPGVPWSEYLKKIKPTAALKKDYDRAVVLAGIIEKRRTADPDTHAKNVEDAFNELADKLAILNGDKARPASIIKYGGTDKFGGAKWAEASILSKDHGEGSTPGDYAPIWNNLENLGLGLGKTVRQRWYVQGHLLNHNLGGPGMRFNLTPITKEANNKHRKIVETDLKNMVLQGKGKIIYYKITALDPPPKGTNPRLKELKLKDKTKGLTKKEQDELKAVEALQQLSAGFKTEAAVLDQDSAGKYTIKTTIASATTTIPNNIDRDSATTYGYD